MPQPSTFVVSWALPEQPAVPLAFQEPKTASDTPAGIPTSPGATTTPGTPAGTAPQGAPPSPCDNYTFLYLGLFMALMYFMMVRPEQKRRKEQQAMLGSIKVGDRIVTIAGMHGTVQKLDEKTVTLQVDTVRMTFDRSAVARIERDAAAGKDAKPA
jgi:preprotein translocase subunit YajC